MGWDSAGKFIDDGWDVVKQVAKGNKAMKSNNAINPISNFTGAIEGVGRIVKGEGFGEAITNTFAKSMKEVDGKRVVDKWDNGKIAGSFLGAAAVGRVATGGGAYKDGNGNINLVGLPFV